MLVENRALHLDVGAGLLDAVAHFLGFLIDFINTAADETLDGIEGVVGIHDRLTFGDLSDQLVLILGVSNHGGRRAEALGVGDDGGLATLHHGYAAVCGAKVNADNLAHRCPPPENAVLNHVIFISRALDRRGVVPEQAGWMGDPAQR